MEYEIKEMTEQERLNLVKIYLKRVLDKFRNNTYICNDKKYLSIMEDN